MQVTMSKWSKFMKREKNKFQRELEEIDRSKREAELELREAWQDEEFAYEYGDDYGDDYMVDDDWYGIEDNDDAFWDSLDDDDYYWNWMDKYTIEYEEHFDGNYEDKEYECEAPNMLHAINQLLDSMKDTGVQVSCIVRVWK